MAELQKGRTLRQLTTHLVILDENHKQAIQNLLIEQAELLADLELAEQEINTRTVEFATLVAEVTSLAIETRRAEKYVEHNTANDPSYRLVRDSARLQWASEMAKATRTAYMAARRAEYEYAESFSDD